MGKKKVSAQWAFVCLGHNLPKILQGSQTVCGITTLGTTLKNAADAIELATKGLDYYQKRKLAAFFEGMKRGGKEFEEFCKDYESYNDERKSKWHQVFRDVINSKSLKCLPSVGWLIYKSESDEENSYIYVKTAQRLIQLNDGDFDFLVSLGQEREKEKTRLDIAKNSQNENVMQKFLVCVWESVKKSPHFEQKFIELTQNGFVEKFIYQGSFAPSDTLPKGTFTVLFDQAYIAFNQSQTASIDFYG